MRALFPPDPTTGSSSGTGAGDVDVHDWYGRGWTATGGLRLNFIASVDGAITVDGVARGLQTPGDTRVFDALRDLADVVLVAAGTARAEGYRTVRLPEHRRNRRRDTGFRAELPTAVVSRGLELDPRGGLFAGSGADRTIVITCGAADPARRAALAAVADVVVAGDDDVDPAAARATLVDRGLQRILCEGGPRLTAALLRAGVVDELDLSVSPLLVGPGVDRMVSGAAWQRGPVPLRLAALLEEDGALFARYLPTGSGGPHPA